MVKILLCGGCAPVAKKIQVELDREIERAKHLTHNWLQQHIMGGGLFHVNSGDPDNVGAKEYAARVLLGREPVQPMLSEEKVPPIVGSSPGGGRCSSAEPSSR